MSYYLALTILILSVIQGNISSYVYADEGGIPIMHWRKSSREQPNVLTALSKLSSQDISSASTSLDSIQYNISQTIRVCALASSSTCADVEMLSSLLSVLVHGQSKKGIADARINFSFLAINTGDHGVIGMTRLIQVAPNCSIVTGPGRIELVQSLTPIFNFYALPQLDYATAEDFLTTQGTMYPYYMRTVPDNSYIYSVHAAVCSYFAWERVIIMTSNDTVGTNRARSMQNKLQRQGVYVEQVYYIQDVARNEISKTFVDIYAYAVSRIIILLFSLHGDDADMFYNLIDEYSYMTNYVFFLGRELCMYGYTHPSARAKLQSSICALPYVSSAKLDELNKHIFDDTPKGRVSQDGDVQNSVSEEVERLLRSGGFASMVSKCRTESIRNFSAFAVDAAYSIITASEQAQALQKNLNKCGGLDNSTSHPNGVFTIKADGSRPSADFAVDIAVSNVTLQFGIWQDSASPHFRANVQDNQWLWMTNTTSVPLDTFRDMSFLLRSSLSTSPFTIVLCIVGFVGTLTIFSIWYNHFIVQKRMEATLKSNAVPVTEEELQMLRKGSSVV